MATKPAPQNELKVGVFTQTLYFESGRIACKEGQVVFVEISETGKLCWIYSVNNKDEPKNLIYTMETPYAKEYIRFL
jgi:hypothetical protein